MLGDLLSPSVRAIPSRRRLKWFPLTWTPNGTRNLEPQTSKALSDLGPKKASPLVCGEVSQEIQLPRTPFLRVDAASIDLAATSISDLNGRPSILLKHIRQSAGSCDGAHSTVSCRPLAPDGPGASLVKRTGGKVCCLVGRWSASVQIESRSEDPAHPSDISQRRPRGSDLCDGRSIDRCDEARSRKGPLVIALRETDARRATRWDDTL